MSKARFTNAVVCEDVRHEVSGIYSLMGVFCGGVSLTGPQTAKAPKLPLAFYVEAEISDRTDFQLEFKRKKSSKGLLKFSGDINRTDDDNEAHFAPEALDCVAIAIPKNDVPIGESGEYVLRGRLNGGRWSELLSFHVFINRQPA